MEKLNIKVEFLAWPFGIYNDELENAAADAGYVMAFTIDAIPANRNYKPMAQPRYMIVDKLSVKTFERIASSAGTTSPLKAERHAERARDAAADTGVV